MKYLPLAALMSLIVGCNVPVASADEPKKTPSATEGAEAMPAKPRAVEKTAAEWKAELTDEEFRILRKKGTERAFTGKYWDHKGEGTYVCAGCGQPLYSSETKFDSGTGWPSFWAAVSEEAVDTESDRTLWMVRTELLCSRCGGHLGHVFDDGPKPTGKRHCINSASLEFVPAESAD